jgi:hypothetical protein
MSRKRGRPQLSANTGQSYELAEWINVNINELSGMTNAEIAAELGYERGNIVAMWRTGKTRIALKPLSGIARLTKTPLETLLPLWLEQYAREKGVRPQPYLDILSRIVTPAEYRVVEALRRTGLNPSQLTQDQYNLLSLVLLTPEQRASLFEA